MCVMTDSWEVVAASVLLFRRLEPPFTRARARHSEGLDAATQHRSMRSSAGATCGKPKGVLHTSRHLGVDARVFHGAEHGLRA
jgi:acyl-coenzyme A synthetase/AMP-(fatty) acid ligase